MATRQTYLASVSVGTSSVPTYLPIDGRWLGSADLNSATHRWTASGTARGLRIKLDAAPGAGKTRTFDVVVDGLTTLTVTLSDLQTAANISGSESIAEDAFVCVAYAGTGSPTATTAHISVVVDYDDDGVSCYGGGGGFSGSGNRNTGAFSSGTDWSNTGSIFNRNVAPCAGTIDRFVCDQTDAVPAGQTMVLDIEINGALQSLNLTMSPGATETSNEMDCSVAFVAGDVVSVKATASYTANTVLRFGLRVVATDGYSIMSSGVLDLPGSNATRYEPPTQGPAATSTTETPTTVPGGLSAFQARDLYVRATARNLTIDPVTVTARLNGGSTALAATTPVLTVGNTGTVSNISDVITVDPGDLFNVRFVTGSRWFQGLLSWGMVQYALASPEGSPAEEEPTEAIPGVIGPIIWVTVPREQIASGSPGSPDELIIPIDAYSDLELQDPSTYYGSWKDPWLLHAGDAARFLSDPLTGELTASTFPYTLADPEFRFREQLASDTDKYWTRYPNVFRMTSRANRAVLGRPFVAFAGPVVDAQPINNAWDITLGDLITQRILRDKLQIPWRLIRDGFLDQLEFVSDKLDLEQPEPIIYGTHDRVAAEQGSPPADAATGYQVVPIYLGIKDGDHVWMVAGHACKSITVFVDGEERDAGDGWNVDLSTDLVSSTYGVTRRYALIRSSFGGSSSTWWRARTSEADQVAIGDKQLTAAVEGIEDVGDGSGTLITDLYEQFEHFLVNFVVHAGPDSYQSGDWLTCPTWDITDQVITVLDLASFDTVSSIAAARFGSELVGAPIIGARAGDRANAGKWIADFNRSGWCQFGQTHPYQLGITTLHPTQAAKDAAVLYTDNYETLKDSFSTAVQWDRHRTSVPWRNDYEHTTGLWQGSGVEYTPESTNYPESDADIREYPFAPGHDQGSHLASLEATLISNPPRMIRFSTTVGPDPVDGDSLAYRNLGDYITYLHYDAVQPDVDARAIRLAQVQRVTISGSDRRIHVDALDCDDLIGSGL